MDGDDGHRVSNALVIGHIARHRVTSRRAGSPHVVMLGNDGAGFILQARGLSST
jgi:hypothetical protein